MSKRRNVSVPAALPTLACLPPAEQASLPTTEPDPSPVEPRHLSFNKPTACEPSPLPLQGICNRSSKAAPADAITTGNGNSCPGGHPLICVAANMAGLECDVHMCITYRQYDALKMRCSNLSAELAETTSRHLAAELQAQTAARGSVSMNSALPLTVSALGGIGGDTATQAKLMNDLEGKLSKSHNENVMLAREFKRALKDAAAAKAEKAEKEAKQRQ